MKFFDLKLKKDNTPSLSSLRPPIFDTNLYWLLSIGTCLLVVIITTSIGLKLFFNEYFETYKKQPTASEFNDLINIDRLNNAISKRSQFINKPNNIPSDPSI